MKRNFLTFISLLAIFVLVNFSFVLAQDPGIPDTCYVERLQKVLPNSHVVLNVYLINDSAIGGYQIPLTFPDTLSTLAITCDSVSFVGTRTTTAGYYGSQINNAKHRLKIYAAWGTQLDPGNGSLAKIYFSTGSGWDSTQYVPVDTVTIPPDISLEFTNALGGPYLPIFGKGALEVREVNTPSIPTVFSLSQNYPNPFNPKTLIRFTLPKDSWVKMEVYNILGQKVRTLVDEKLTAGVKEVEWDSKDVNGLEVASGIYFYRIKADDFSDIKKMVMLK